MSLVKRNVGDYNYKQTRRITNGLCMSYMYVASFVRIDYSQALDHNLLVFYGQ